MTPRYITPQGKLAKEYLIALSQLAGIGPKKILKIGNYISDNNISINSPTDLSNVLKALNIKVKKEHVTDSQMGEAYCDAVDLVKLHQNSGIGITTYFDDDYPAILRQTVNEEGKLDPPTILYYKGDLSICNMPTLAVIGTREVTEYGKSAGLFLSQEFAKRGFCIVSGLAIGCDTCGHRGALDVGGKTVAFLAHGLDTVYPPENKGLAEEIVAKGGLLMSEYPIGGKVNRYNLVARDRLQAGLSLATLVVQTGEQGGTMHAANTTLIDGKPLYAIKFKEDWQNQEHKTLGNALLVKKGGKYISGGDNIDSVEAEIQGHVKSNKTLFD